MATIVVEDGTNVTGANSYVSEAELTTYAADRGITISGDTSQLLIQAMDYIEHLEYKGYRSEEDQPLSWPRYYVPKHKIYWYETDEIPRDLKEGQMEVALAIDADLSPLRNVDREVKRQKVGSLEVEYSDSAATQVIVRKINNKLKDLLAPGNSGIMFTVGKA